MLILCALVAETAVIEVDAFGAEPFGQEVGAFLQETSGWHVEHVATATAVEMGMRSRHAVEAGVVAVDSEHGSRALAYEKTKRVVNGRFRECGYFSHQSVVDFVGRGVRVVLVKVFHNGQPLY